MAGLCWLLAGPPVGAVPAEPVPAADTSADAWRVVLWLDPQLANEVGATVDASLTDLEVELVRESAPPELVPTPEAAPRNAGTLAEARSRTDADLLVWVQPAGGRMYLVVAPDADGNALVRDLGTADDLATVAPAVRSTIQALIEGGVIGISAPSVQEPKPEPEPYFACVYRW